MKLLLLILLVSPFALYGQKIVRSTIGCIGSSLNNNGIIIQQSVGQPALITNEKFNDGSGLRQGFIQPIWYETESNDLKVTLYPNPNQGEFSFQTSLTDELDFDYEVMDQQGKIVLKGSGLGNSLMSVNIPNAARGVYHLNVRSEAKISTFKINVVY
jgi:hypothetical protein